jgi:hypothetical protein
MQSITDCVSVLCSVDILKMKSTFFYDILSQQEKDAATTPNNIHKNTNPTKQWRDPIIMPEASPFEAAAFLESLHEGRALFKGEWNLTWARLR